MRNAYLTRFGLPGAAAYSVVGVPDPEIGVDGDQAWSQNGTTYKKASGTWVAQSGGGGGGISFGPAGQSFTFTADADPNSWWGVTTVKDLGSWTPTQSGRLTFVGADYDADDTNWDNYDVYIFTDGTWPALDASSATWSGASVDAEGAERDVPFTAWNAANVVAGQPCRVMIVDWTAVAGNTCGIDGLLASLAVMGPIEGLGFGATPPPMPPPWTSDVTVRSDGSLGERPIIPDYGAGSHSHIEGYLPVATGTGSHAEGQFSAASGNGAHAEGSSAASGDHSHAEGGATASGNAAHAEGGGTASGTCSHAEGESTTASGRDAHAEGTGTTASGTASHAEGNVTSASAEGAHAEGMATVASGLHSHAEGLFTTASGDTAHAEGDGTRALGTASHVEGLRTAAQDFGHAQGLYALAARPAEDAVASSSFAAGIPAQVCTLTLAAETTDASPTNMLLGEAGSPSGFPLNPDTLSSIRGHLAAMSSDGTVAAMWEFAYGLKSVGGVVSEVGGTSSVQLIASDGAALAVALSTSGGEPVVTVTGVAATTIRWVCALEIVEVRFA